MRKTLLTILTFTIALQFLKAQSSVASPEEIEQFYKTTTCVVLDNDMFQNYDAKITEAVKNHWTITPFEFISLDEFKKRQSKKEYSFLIRTKVFFEKDKSSTNYSFLSLVLGGKKTTNLNRMPDLGSFPLSYYNVDFQKYTYKLGAIVQFLQNHVELTKKDPSLNNKNILKYYSKNLKELETKTIYFIKDEIDKPLQSKDKIAELYSGQVQCVSRERIIEAINNNENALFLHKVGPPKGKSGTRCFKIIMGTNDGKLYYFDYHKIKKGKKADAFLESDFKNLEKMK